MRLTTFDRNSQRYLPSKAATNMESIDQRNSHSYRSRSICASCGAVIIHGEEVKALDGITLCRCCAFGVKDDPNLDEPYIESSLLVH
jgi:hypothetical protein